MSTTTKPTVQQLIDLVQEIKNVSEISLPTTVPASTPVSKQEQMASAATTLPVTKEDSERFKREMLQLSTCNSEYFPTPSQSMPGTYTQKIINVSEKFNHSNLLFHTYAQVLSFPARRISIHHINYHSMMYTLTTITHINTTYIQHILTTLLHY